MTHNGDAMIAEAKTLISERLQEYITKNLDGASDGQSAKHFKVGRTTISRWLRKEALPSKDLFEMLTKKLRFTEAEKQKIRTAIARISSIRSLKGHKTRVGDARPAPKETDAQKSVSERLKDVEQRLLAVEEAISDGGGSQERDEEPQENQKPRFALNAKNFIKVFSRRWSEEEVNDTCLLIEELRKRINVIARHPSDSVRQETLAKLGRELDELWHSYQIARSVIPMEAVKILDLESHTGRLDR